MSGISVPTLDRQELAAQASSPPAVSTCTPQIQGKMTGLCRLFHVEQHDRTARASDLISLCDSAMPDDQVRTSRSSAMPSWTLDADRPRQCRGLDPDKLDVIFQRGDYRRLVVSTGTGSMRQGSRPGGKRSTWNTKLTS